MLQEERKNYILNKLEKYGVVRVADLSKELNATDVTIRHDLNEIQNDGLAIRIHGGAKVKNLSSAQMLLAENSEKNVEEKKRIAEQAICYINNKDCIFLDSSATVLALANILKSGTFDELTVLTTSLPIFNVLSEVENYSLIFVGGRFNRKLKSVNGPFTNLVMANMHVDKAFFGAAGVDIRNGFTGPYDEENTIKQIGIEKTDTSYVLVDHNKFGRSYLYKFAGLGDINVIITDTRPDNDLLEAAREAGTEIYY